MARSIGYWYDIIVAEKTSSATLSSLQPNIDSSQQLLADVTTTSKVARWRLWAWCVAACAYVLDVLFDLLKIDLEDIASKSRYGTIPWYISIAKAFQYGDTLVWMNNQYQYAADNPAARIITQAAGSENANGVILKVAKDVGGGVLGPLSSGELAAFKAYISDTQKVKPAGVPVLCRSNLPDELQVYFTCNYDPQVLDSNGQLIGTTVKPLEDCVKNFIASLKFNGVLELSELEDAMQLVPGVISGYLTSANARYGTNPFLSINERYTADAGYMVIDAANPLSTTITYIPSV